MYRSSRNITLVLIGSATLLPGCRNSQKPSADFRNNPAQSTTSTRHGASYGRYGFVPAVIPMGGRAANNTNAAVSGSPGSVGENQPASSSDQRTRSGFGSTGKSRGGGWMS